MNSRILSVLAIVALLCCGITDAQIPRKLNYQGFLTNPSGAPVNASVQMVFTIYPAATGAASVHTETRTVTVSNGIFNVILGTNATLSATFDASYWLGVAVGVDPEMSPRQPLSASPYALRAVTAESLAPGGNIVLTDPSTASAGNIMKGTSRFIHNPGFANTFIGADSGNFTVTGSSNTITGAFALGNVTSGQSNTASGVFALNGNTSGSYNIALGIGAGGSLTTGDFNINIGNAGVAGEAATTRIGTSQTRAFMAGIRGVTPAVNDALPVVIDSNGQLGTGVSVSSTLAGDVTGPQSATVVALVGGVTAANVAAGANLANAAANANTASRIVKRDASGNFSAGTITGTFSGPLTGNVTGNVSGSASGFTGTLGGDVGGTQNATVVSQVAGVTAANVATGANLANASTSANTANTIVRRDASGNFTAGRIESTSGGVKFPDGSIQTTAAAGAVAGTFQWQVVAGTTQQTQSNTGYVANNAALVTVTLPTAPSVGDTVRVSGAGGGGWKIAQNVLQSVTGSFFGLTFVDNWVSRDSIRAWSALASSADGSKLVATVGGPGSGQIYTSADLGTTWTPRESVRNWQSVASSSDGSKLVAVAYFDHPYTSTDSGVTWTQRDTGTSRYWNSVASSADGSKLVASDGSIQVIHTSTDSGVTWTPRASGHSWTAVASSSDGSKLVALAYNDNLYTSTDSGVTWTARDSARWWKAVASSADGSKLVAAAQGPSGGQLYTSADSGATWTPRESNRFWTAVTSSLDGSRLAAVADGVQIYTSSDFGVGWTARETSRQWTAVASSADGIRVVAAATGISPGGGGLIYTSVPAVNSLPTSTTLGVTGYLTGTQRSAIELQFIGGGQFMPLSYVGTIGSY